MHQHAAWQAGGVWQRVAWGIWLAATTTTGTVVCLYVCIFLNKNICMFLSHYIKMCSWVCVYAIPTDFNFYRVYLKQAWKVSNCLALLFAIRHIWQNRIYQSLNLRITFSVICNNVNRHVLSIYSFYYLIVYIIVFPLSIAICELRNV